MSATEMCSRCGATSPVVQGGVCGGCATRDSRSKPVRAETTKIGSVHESGGAKQSPKLTDEMLDLITRLRERHTIVPGCPNDPLASLINPDGPEAADRLSSLEEEKRVRDEVLQYIWDLTQREDISDGGKVVFIATKLRALSAGVGR